MKAMILAAGKGERMRPLTDSVPKPLLRVQGEPLISHHLKALAAAGVTEVIINVSYLGGQIQEYVADGARWSLSIFYSKEPFPLETGGAISFALGLLGAEPFLLVNADVFTRFNFLDLIEMGLKDSEDGCLVLVPNPDFKPCGDFSVGSNAKLAPLVAGQEGYTFSGISLLRPALVANYSKRRESFPLVEVFNDALLDGRLAASVFSGCWSDVGTPERLNRLNIG